MSRVTQLTARETQPGYWTVTSDQEDHEHVHGRIVQLFDETYAWEVHRPVPPGTYAQGLLTGPAKTHEEALEKIRHEWPGGPGNSWPTESNDA